MLSPAAPVAQLRLRSSTMRLPGRVGGNTDVLPTGLIVLLVFR
jgi:hypothetical protein